MGHLLLHEDEHLLIEKVAGDPILIVRRKRTMPTVDTIRSFAGTLRAALSRIDRSRHGMLVDLRAAPLRTGDEIDRALVTFRAEVTRDVLAVARLVATSVGALQVQRLGGQGERPTRSFADEDEALAWLRAQLPSSRRPRSL